MGTCGFSGLAIIDLPKSFTASVNCRSFYDSKVPLGVLVISLQLVENLISALIFCFCLCLYHAHVQQILVIDCHLCGQTVNAEVLLSVMQLTSRILMDQ